MKHLTGIASGLALIWGPVLCAQGTVPLRTISVSGTVVTETAPDTIVWSISLVSRDADIRAAKKANDEHIAAILSLRENLGIDLVDLTTGRVRIKREYERDERGRRGDFKHFAISRGITIRQRDFGRFDEYLDALVSSGDMEVSFQFESSRTREVRAETRLKAVAVACEKAAAMAAAAGATLGRVLSIDEHRPEVRRTFEQNFAVPLARDIRPEIDLASGTSVPAALKEKVTVFATFELE